MSNEPTQLELPNMPEKLPDAPPGWHWRWEATYGANGRLVLYQDPVEHEKQASKKPTK